MGNKCEVRPGKRTLGVNMEMKARDWVVPWTSWDICVKTGIKNITGLCQVASSGWQTECGSSWQSTGLGRLSSLPPESPRLKGWCSHLPEWWKPWAASDSPGEEDVYISMGARRWSHWFFKCQTTEKETVNVTPSQASKLGARESH